MGPVHEFPSVSSEASPSYSTNGDARVKKRVSIDLSICSGKDESIDMDVKKMAERSRTRK